MPRGVLDNETRREIYAYVTEKSPLRDQPDFLNLLLGFNVWNQDPWTAGVVARVFTTYDHLWEESERFGKPWWHAAALLTLYQARQFDTGDQTASDPRSNTALITTGRHTGHGTHSRREAKV